MSSKPNFFVVGAPKSGTTSIYEYLSSSNEVCLSKKKELHFFSSPYLENCSNGPGDSFVLKEIPRTEEKYLSWFKCNPTHKVIADISPSYIHFPVAEDIKKFSPNAKVLIILRNPVLKAYSQYSHLYLEGREWLSFEDALDAEESRIQQGYSDFWQYKHTSLYSDKVKRFHELFGVNLKVFIFESFIDDTQGHMNELCDWLDIQKLQLEDSKVHNQSGLPKNRLFSKLILSHNPLTWIARRIIPVTFGKKIRTFLVSINTDKKSVINDSTYADLQAYFLEDIKKLEETVLIDTGWYDKSIK